MRGEAMRGLSAGAGDDYLSALIENEPELGYYCKARLAVSSDWNDESVGRSLAVLDEASARGVPAGLRTLRFHIKLLERRPLEEQDFTVLIDLYRRVEKISADAPRVIELFRHAVLCYQTDAFRQGEERFRRLRQLMRNQDNRGIQMQDFWRDSAAPHAVRTTHLRVDRPLSDWRSQGYLADINQTVPFRPRHFSPQPRKGAVVQCVLRFEFNGLLAVPPRFVTSRRRSRGSGE
jgi:hypothetical protein